MQKVLGLSALLFSITISNIYAAPANPTEAASWLASVTFYLKEANSWLPQSDKKILEGCADVIVVGLDGKGTPMSIPAAEGEHPFLGGFRAMQAVRSRIQRIEALHDYSIDQGGLGLAEFTGLRDVPLMDDSNVGPFASGLLGCKLLLNDIKVMEEAIARRHTGELEDMNVGVKKEIVRELLSEESALKPHISDWERKPKFQKAVERARKLPYVYRHDHHRDAWELIVNRYLGLVEELQLGLREDFPEIIDAIVKGHQN